ncbi:MAG: hypothetical protein J2P41_09625 [Blastocatellia bacterium]|nr:hypothetical protein [Blastocatellia bacterium]
MNHPTPLAPMKRATLAFIRLVLLVTIVAVAAMAGERKQKEQSEALQAEELKITSNLTDQEVEPTAVLTFNLNRPLAAAEGRLAVLIGETDISNLLTPSETGINYLPRILPLPAGTSPVKVFLVSPANDWRELAQLTLRVKSLPSSQSTAGQQEAPASNPAQTAAKTKKYNFEPSITVGMKSQMAERHSPESNRPERPTFTDATLQASLKSGVTDNWFGNKMQFDIVGSSFRNEALRFAERGENAPKVDLGNYLMEIQLGKAKIDSGNITFGSSRHLINGFGSRGVSFSMPLGKNIDFSLAALNGTSIVGWDNFFGLANRKHQIIAALLGFEFIRERPGGLRFEVSALSGSLQPIAGFNQGVINDAEQSKGASLRLLATDKAQRLKLDTAFTRSRFNNPSDPLLEQNQQVVPVHETTRDALYLDLSYALLQNNKLSATQTANLTINYRLERVDPLFRSVAAESTQADRFQNEVEITGAIGAITATLSHQLFHDNLDDVPSLLKTESDRDLVIVVLPLASLLSPAHQPKWLPRLAYNMTRVHQFGEAAPLNGGFTDPSQDPNQLSTIHDFSSAWQFPKWSLTYHFNYSFQDNRQQGRDLADLKNQIHGLTLGLTPLRAFDFNFDLSVESARNFENARTDRTLRAGINTNWRVTPRMVLNLIASNSLTGDLARISRTRSTEFDLNWSYQFTHGERGWRKFTGQFFLRYADRFDSSRDFLFGLNNLTRLKTLNGGISFVFF